MDMLKLIDAGERIGLHGPELQEFVRAEQEKERGSRALEREVAKEKAERERLIARENAAIERESAERAREISKEKAESDFQLVEKQIELERMKANSNNSNDSHETLGDNQNARIGRPNPRFQCFDEQKDKIDSYLQTFERFASNIGWEVESYGTYLSTLLTGKARDVYNRLPIALANDYGYLKKSLLEKYQLTVDDYRRKFFSVRQANGEKCANFWGDLEYNLDQWLGLVNRRIAIATSTMATLSSIWTSSRLSLALKMRLYNSLIISIITYSSASWTLTKAQKKRLDAFNTKALRRIVGVRWYDYVTNASILSRTGQPPLTTTIRKLRLGAFGHICRLQPGTQAIDILASTPPSSWRRPRGRPPLRWADQIVNDTQLSLSDAVTATQDRPTWRSIVRDATCPTTQAN